jgi:hypothetical protein
LKEDKIIIDEAFLRSGANGKAWNKKQLSILGIKWPIKRGWMHELYGKEIDRGTAKEFLKAKRKSTTGKEV